MILIEQGDITKLAVDAIVNAANQVVLGNAPKKLVSEGNFAGGEPEGRASGRAAGWMARSIGE